MQVNTSWSKFFKLSLQFMDMSIPKQLLVNSQYSLLSLLLNQRLFMIVNPISACLQGWRQTSNLCNQCNVQYASIKFIVTSAYNIHNTYMYIQLGKDCNAKS